MAAGIRINKSIYDGRERGDGMPGRYGKVKTCALIGVAGVMLEAEVAVLPGLPAFDVVGPGDSAVRESRNRIRAAVRSSGYDLPSSRIIASLAPAWVRKEGSGFDLPLALALLAACGVVKKTEGSLCIFGELSLTGEVRPIPGCVGRALAALENGIKTLVLPWENSRECACVEGVVCIPVRRLADAVDYLNTGLRPPPDDFPAAITPMVSGQDLSGIVGQDFAKRALTVAAAGWHSLLMLGSPGSGKSTLAAALPGILPDLGKNEVMEVARIHSAAGLLLDGHGPSRSRPYRRPHHTVSRTAILGGGTPPRPGEISLAHKGVLFLDEMTEFQPHVLDVLRQPMEEKHVSILRAGSGISFPADFLLAGAANPCRCGKLLESDGCRCTDEQVRQHMGRIGGPLLDRFDLRVNMTSISPSAMQASISPNGLSESAPVRQRIALSWQIQWERAAAHGHPPLLNGQVPPDRMKEVMELPDSICAFAANLAEKRLSTRGYQRMLRVARTLSDLEDGGPVRTSHVQEAFQYKMERAGGY